MKTLFILLLAIAVWLAETVKVNAQGTTAFTYQGQLRDGGTNANGTYRMIFKLYDAITNGNQVGSSLSNTLTLANGLFTVPLDFGGGVFNGSARWLDINVEGETLEPRVAITPTPYALYALNGGTSNGVLTAETVRTSDVSLGVGQNSFELGVDENGDLVLGYGSPSNQGPNLIPAWAIPLIKWFVGDLLMRVYHNMEVNGKLEVTGSLKASVLDLVENVIFGGWRISIASFEGTADTILLKNNGANRVAILPTGEVVVFGTIFGQSNAVIRGDLNITEAGSKLVFPDGSVQTTAASGFPQAMRTFTNSGTFIVPSNVTRIIVEVWGGGGGGGNPSSQAHSGGGGGGGGYAKRIFTVLPDESCPYTVGAGGTAENSGGNTSFSCNSGSITGTGGVGGARGNPSFASGGSGGGGIGMLVVVGGSGGSTSYYKPPGGGGNAGNGGAGGRGTETLAPAESGRFPGGGGGGAGLLSDNEGTHDVGAPGAQGLVLIYY